MITNKEIKYIKSLSNKKFRDEYGVFAIEGEKMVAEALASDFEVLNVYRKEEIGEETMSRLSALTSPPPVIAVVRQKTECKLQIHNGLYLILDGIRDPGNMGTMLRLADWFGIDAVVASPDSVEWYNPKVIQATMGAIFRVKFHSMDTAQFASMIRTSGGKVYGTFLDGKDMYSRDLDVGESQPVAIAIGNESNGIGASLAATVSDRIKIPPFPASGTGCESLNAATAAAITIAEFRRRTIAK